MEESAEIGSWSVDSAEEKLRVVSLFSGAGGFDCGFHLTGKFEVCAANELKHAPAATLAQNLGLRLIRGPAHLRPGDLPAAVHGDVADLVFAHLKEVCPDVLIGGPPCQDFSVVKGSVRKGIEVKRGRLYGHFIRAVAVLRPPMFVFENVPGLMSANGGAAYRAVLDDFRNPAARWQEMRPLLGADSDAGNGGEVGYEILFSGVVDASALGVPQARRRLIVVGLRKDLAGEIGRRWREMQKVFEYRMRGSGTLVSRYPLTCLEAFEGYPLCNLRDKYWAVMQAYEGIWRDARLPRSGLWKQEVWDRLSFDAVQDYLLVNGIRPESPAEIDAAMEEHADILGRLGYLGRPVDQIRPEDGSNRPADESSAVRERMFMIPPGENHEFVRGTPWEVEGRGISLIYRRPFPLKPAPTVVAYGGGGTWGYHYERTRSRLTNRERARLQTFPDSYLFVGGESAVRAQIGEAVPPLLALKIAEAVAEVLDAVQG